MTVTPCWIMLRSLVTNPEPVKSARMTICRNPMPLNELDVARELARPETKRRFVRSLFDTIEGSYDCFTRWFSLGMDAKWKRRLVRLVSERTPPGGRMLDLATGTGDIAAAICSRRPETTVVAIDLSIPMLRRGLRGSQGRYLASVADMAVLPHPSRFFASVTAGYAFRNAPQHSVALAEAFRVLEPGGWLATLDFYLPESTVWRRLFVGYLRGGGRLIGRMVHGAPESYGYISSSLQRWMTAAEFSEALRGTGFEIAVEHRMLRGGIAIHVARRP